jgi:hypothetical protein
VKGKGSGCTPPRESNSQAFGGALDTASVLRVFLKTVSWELLRFSILFFLASTVVHASGTVDPAFSRIPFDEWLTQHADSHFRWTAAVAHAQLSFHQRLISQIEVEVDGKDLETRRNDGELVSFFQVTDHEGTRYQGHGAIQLNKLDQNIKAATVQSDQRAFFLPGDYQLGVVLYDTGTKEHAAIQTKFRISGPSSAFLTEAWRGLPSVEFIMDKESPESWYLPDIQGRLDWGKSLQDVPHLDVLLNVVPGSRRTPSEGLPALLPTLKVLVQGGPSSEQAELLDLSRQRAVFHSDAKGIDWPVLKAALGDSSTASIDVHSLSQQHQEAQFFVAQVRRMLRAREDAGNKPVVLVILSTPVAFESGEDLSPISLESLPPCHVFYIRYRAARERASNPYAQQMGGRGRGMRMGGPIGRRPVELNVIDQLEATLKPLNPKLFDVESAEEMTKALTEIQKAMIH